MVQNAKYGGGDALPLCRKKWDQTCCFSMEWAFSVVLVRAYRRQLGKGKQMEKFEKLIEIVMLLNFYNRKIAKTIRHWKKDKVLGTSLS